MAFGGILGDPTPKLRPGVLFLGHPVGSPNGEVIFGGASILPPLCTPFWGWRLIFGSLGGGTEGGAYLVGVRSFLGRAWCGLGMQPILGGGGCTIDGPRRKGVNWTKRAW